MLIAMRVLAISGSLRRNSINTALLKAAQLLAPPDMKISIYENLGNLPLFNPDFEGSEPAVVRDLWRKLDAADGLLIASPEYAHGVTGAMKNCLDWLVGGHEFVSKPVVVINAAPRAHHAFDSLKETIRTMHGALIEDACVTLPVVLSLAESASDENAIAGNDMLSSLLRQSLAGFK